MAKYTVAVDLYHQRVDDPADQNTQPEYRRWHKGDEVDLSGAEESRLVNAGAVVKAGEPLPGEEQEQEPEQEGAPSKSASKADWVDYAVAQGADRDVAEASTKDDLITEFGGGQ